MKKTYTCCCCGGQNEGKTKFKQITDDISECSYCGVWLVNLDENQKGKKQIIINSKGEQKDLAATTRYATLEEVVEATIKNSTTEENLNKLEKELKWDTKDGSVTKTFVFRDNLENSIRKNLFNHCHDLAKLNQKVFGLTEKSLNDLKSDGQTV